MTPATTPIPEVLHFQPDGTNDEIGRFEQFFARTMDLVSSTLKSLSQGRAA